MHECRYIYIYIWWHGKLITVNLARPTLLNKHASNACFSTLNARYHFKKMERGIYIWNYRLENLKLHVHNMARSTWLAKYAIGCFRTIICYD